LLRSIKWAKQCYLERFWTKIASKTRESAAINCKNERNVLLRSAKRENGVIWGGLTVADIHRKKGLDKNEKILDFMGSTELIANLFRISQTEEKLKIEQTSSAGEANEIHYKIAEKIRKAMIDMGTTLPEDLPTPEKSIQTVEREEIRKLRNSKTKLMLDE
jgi:DNA-damage-inducible protein D